MINGVKNIWMHGGEIKMANGGFFGSIQKVTKMMEEDEKKRKKNKKKKKVKK